MYSRRTLQQYIFSFSFLAFELLLSNFYIHYKCHISVVIFALNSQLVRNDSNIIFTSKRIHLYSRFYTLHLPTYLLFPALFVPLRSSRFLAAIIFHLPEGLLSFLIAPVCWWLILSVLLCLQKYFAFIFKRYFYWVQDSRVTVFPFWYFTKVVSDSKYICSVVYNVSFFSSAWF